MADVLIYKSWLPAPSSPSIQINHTCFDDLIMKIGKVRERKKRERMIDKDILIDNVLCGLPLCCARDWSQSIIQYECMTSRVSLRD